MSPSRTAMSWPPSTALMTRTSERPAERNESADGESCVSPALAVLIGISLLSQAAAKTVEIAEAATSTFMLHFIWKARYRGKRREPGGYRRPHIVTIAPSG